MQRSRIMMALFAGSCLVSSPLAAQSRGEGGTGVNEDTELPQCAAPFGVASLVEDQPEQQPQTNANLALLAQLAGQQSGQLSAVDPLPLLRLLASESNCFQIVERGFASSALQRERELAGIEEPQLASDYLLTARVVYSDTRAGGSRGLLGGVGRALGGNLGGIVGSAVNFNSRTAEAEVLLAAIDVKTGIQVAAASGSARKRDRSIFGGGILGGFGGLGGTYSSTDIGKVTAIAALDAYIKLVETMPAPASQEVDEEGSEGESSSPPAPTQLKQSTKESGEGS